ncbi:hypothetical protein T492DRAFT_843632 [Pavlovales sp. CCMP2436]|nr:hypothetical protein T492DRAFT_843632 [Pavlovales sp. CCMP2436]
MVGGLEPAAARALWRLAVHLDAELEAQTLARAAAARPQPAAEDALVWAGAAGSAEAAGSPADNGALPPGAGASAAPVPHVSVAQATLACHLDELPAGAVVGLMAPLEHHTAVRFKPHNSQRPLANDTTSPRAQLSRVPLELPRAEPEISHCPQPLTKSCSL